jgi:hypothetical protein
MSGDSGALGATNTPRALSGAGHKVIGAKHVRDGRPCQDDLRVEHAGDVTLVALADGHGSCVHADVGARLAVEVTVAALVAFIGNLRSEGRADVRSAHSFGNHPLRVQLVRAWAEAVREVGGADAKLMDYGSTLLFAVATPELLMLGQLGDGDILLVNAAGAVSRPIPTDPACFGEETPSLCLPEAWTSLRVLAMPLPAEETLVLLSTDGYGKSYASDQDFERIGPDYLQMVRELGLGGVEAHLEDFLTTVTHGGSGDDIALGLIYIPSAPSSVTEAPVSTPDPVEVAAEEPAVETSPLEPGEAL